MNLLLKKTSLLQKGRRMLFASYLVRQEITEENIPYRKQNLKINLLAKVSNQQEVKGLLVCKPPHCLPL